MTSKRQKIAILGGGMGGLTTAYYLSSDPEWDRRFEITVYQIGHRLGGKCASSRGVCDRIQEHGIHGFLGSYYNALPLMADLYQELGRKPGEPLATFEEALFGMNFQMMWEFQHGAFLPWPMRLPANQKCPKKSTYSGLKGSIGAVIDAISGLARLYSALIPKEVGERLQTFLDEARLSLDKVPVARGPDHPIVAMIQAARDVIAAGWPKPALLSDDARRGLIVVDYLSTMVLGALADNVAVKGFDVLDRENWSDWLNRHGVWRLTLASPMARTTVNICYQSPNGDTSLLPQMGAGAYVNWTLKAFDYMGCQVWSFAAGTGETVIAPLYQVLRKRGVKFEFFHKVEALHLNRAKTAVSSVDFTLQATLKNPNRPYRPLIDVKGLPSWPEWPHYDQLVEGKVLKKAGIVLESYWNGWPDTDHSSLKNAKVLRAGHEYDTLVLAMYPGANSIATELMHANNRFAHGINGLAAVQTQAMQLWLNKDVAELGYPARLEAGLHESAVSATYYGPTNGNEEFHYLIPLEGWPAKNTPKAIWYFCGLMPNYETQAPFSDTTYPERQSARVKAHFLQYLRACVAPIWPHATAGALQAAGDPVSLDFSVLVDHRDGTRVNEPDAVGAERFDSQFWRANIDPTELFITSLPGSTAVRMEAWGSGFDNLVLAGDWIYTGINVGSFEGATCSGKLASYAISAYPPLSSIIGYPTIPRPPGAFAYPPPPHEVATAPT